MLPTVRPSRYLLHFAALYFVSSLPLSEGRAGIAWKPSEKYISYFLRINYTISASHWTFRPFLSLFFFSLYPFSQFVWNVH
jgi:hypothetical protein